MTVICALKDARNGDVWIGSDSLAQLSCGGILPGAARKWRLFGKSGAIGLAGWYRSTQLVTRIDEAVLLSCGDPEAVAALIRQTLKADEFIARDGDGPQSYGTTGIIVLADEVWDFDPALTVYQIPEGVLWARGSGSDYAIGAGHALSSAEPERRIRAALDAAMTFDSGCGGHPFVRCLG